MRIDLGDIGPLPIMLDAQDVAVANHLTRPNDKSLSMDFGGKVLVTMSSAEALGLMGKLKLMAIIDAVNVPTLDAVQLRLAQSGYPHGLESLREALGMLVDYLSAQEAEKEREEANAGR